MAERKNTRRKENRKHNRKKKSTLLLLISFATVMTVLTVASDFLDLILIFFGPIGLIISIIIVFTFFLLIYEFGLKRNL